MRKYYLIGSKGREENGWRDIWSEMKRNNCVSIGYAWKCDLGRLYGETEDRIAAELKRKGESDVSGRAHGLFLNLCPGDIVAVKAFAAPIGTRPRLAIHGYAVVRAKGGRVYRFRRRAWFPHQIAVDFLECKEREFHLGGYSQTIHRLDNPSHIRRIFGPVLGKLSKADMVELRERDVALTNQRATTLKRVEESIRRIKQPFTVTAQHNRIQNRLYEFLVRRYGAEHVLMERDHVDVQVRLKNELTLYEVKPHPSALLCLREALGQVMLYAWRANTQTGLRLKLIIVGPKGLTKREEDFLRFLRSKFHGDLGYFAFS